MKKVLLILLLIIAIFIFYSCTVKDKKSSVIDNPDTNEPKDDTIVDTNPIDVIEPGDDPVIVDPHDDSNILYVTFCDECFNREFKVSEFNLSLFSLNITYKDESVISITVIYDMFKTVNGEAICENSFDEAKDYEIVISYKDRDITHTFKLYNEYKVTFLVYGEFFDERVVRSDEVLTDIPNLPTLDGYTLKWDRDDFSMIDSDIEVNAIISEDYEKVLAKANRDLIIKYLDIFNEEINGNITLDEEIDNCNITWESSNREILSEDGKFNKPYKKEDITLKATISYKDYSDTKTVSFNVNVASYKDLTKPLSTGYLYRNYDKMSSKMFDDLDIIYCAFLEFDTNGNITNTSFLDKLKRLIITKAHEKGIYVVASIVGNSSSSATFTTVSKSAAARENLAKNLVDAINKYNLDGIDFDWETPSSDNKTYFTLLCRDVQAKIKANNPNHLLTAAIGGGKWQPPRYDLTNSSQYLDFINLMCYSMVSTGGYYQNALYAHSSYDDSVNKVGRTMVSCSIDESVQIYNSMNVENSKLIPGVAFYAIKQTLTDGAFGNGKSVLYDTFSKNYLKSSDWVYHFDEICKVPYLLSKDGTGFISFDDERSIMEKGKYVKEMGLAGLMNWEIGCDVNCTLLDAQRESLN